MKRFFVKKEYKGQNIGLNILNNLKKPEQMNYEQFTLKTSFKIQNAINFYKKHDHNIINNYYPYINHVSYACVKKTYKNYKSIIL